MKVSQNPRVDASEPSMGFEPMTPGVGDRSSSPLRYEGMEVPPGFEPGCAGLQSATWPLGHGTKEPQPLRVSGSPERPSPGLKPGEDGGIALSGVVRNRTGVPSRSSELRYGDATVRWPVLREVPAFPVTQPLTGQCCDVDGFFCSQAQPARLVLLRRAIGRLPQTSASARVLRKSTFELQSASLGPRPDFRLRQEEPHRPFRLSCKSRLPVNPRALGGIRTPNFPVRSRGLCPVEIQGHDAGCRIAEPASSLIF